MILLPAYQGSMVGVVGLGKSGLAVAKSLEASGAHFVVYDDKLAEDNTGPVGLTPLEEWPWEEISALILSPGVPLTHPAPHPAVTLAKQYGVPIIGDIELLLTAQPDAFVIGITGTNGKSTTTALTAHILKEAGREIEVGGNLGMPALGLKPLGKGGIYVLELSSYQIELMANARVHAAALLNLTPDHLDRHGDMAGYLAAKRHLFDLQRRGDTAVIAVDDGFTESVARELIGLGGNVVPVSVTQRVRHGVYVRDSLLNDTMNHSPLEGESDPPKRIGWGEQSDATDVPQQPFSNTASATPLSSPPTPHGSAVACGSASPAPPQGGSIDLAPCVALKGPHNHQNAAVAYALCRLAGLGAAAIERGLRSFPGLAHRMERVGNIGKVIFVNDSKATNADAAAKALGAYENIYWIAGGLPKAGGIKSLAPFFPRIAKAYLIGQAAADFAATLEGHVAYVVCGTLEIAVRRAAADARANGGEACVMLAPACASWDQWPNFEARGDAFRAQVTHMTHYDIPFS